MDWVSYRALCDQGDVLSRYLLASTSDVLMAAGERVLAQELSRVLAGEPLAKPADHRADAAADFFLVELEPEAVRRIVRAVTAARAAGWRTASGRGLGGFVEAWQEYLDWRTGVHPRSPVGRAGS